MTGYQLVCGCETHSIDATGAIGDNNLFDPFSGHWSDLEVGNRR